MEELGIYRGAPIRRTKPHTRIIPQSWDRGTPLRSRITSVLGSDWISVRDLSDSIDVEPNSIRMCIRSMQAEGLIEIRSGDLTRKSALMCRMVMCHG